MYIFLLLVFVSLAYYLNFRRSRKLLYKFSENLPSVGEWPILGHTHWFIGGPEKLLHNIWTLIRKIDETGTMCKIWIGPTLYVVTSNLDDVQKILDSCMEKDSSYKFLRPWLGNGLFVAPVDLWKSHRRLLLPVFNNRIIEDYIGIFGKQGDTLIKCLEDEVGKAQFDVYEYITSCMLDVVFGPIDMYKPFGIMKIDLTIFLICLHVMMMHQWNGQPLLNFVPTPFILETASSFEYHLPSSGETAMGEKMNVQGNPETPYLRARKTVMSIINMRLFKAWLQPDVLFSLTKLAASQKENIDATHKFTDEVIRKKKIAFENSHIEDIEVKEGPKDILQVLLERKLNFSSVELREHIDSITIAGNDTTALVISYALMLLGGHQDEQEKVYNELKEIFGDSKRHPTKEDLSKMEYLERVIKETMRLYTVVPIIGRKTQKELKLSSCTLPAGVGCAVIPFVMHRSKKIWGPDADTFDPDRFLPEKCAARHPCAYLPFSYGPRNCIGRHFGFLAMKSILSNVLRSYKISSAACDRLKIEILLFPVSGHLISLEKRM